MKFSPCISQCTKDASHCQGCGRSHIEIRETQALTKQLVEHVVKYNYDDPEAFLSSINDKVLKRSKLLQAETNE